MKFYAFGGIVDESATAVLIGLTVTIVRTVFLFQKGHSGLSVHHPQIHGINTQLAVLVARPTAQLGVDFLLGDRERAGRFRVRPFRNRFPLLPLRGEQAELFALFC